MRPSSVVKEGGWWCLAYPVWASGILTVSGRHDDHPTRDGWTASCTRQFGPNHDKKHRRIGPGGAAFVAWIMHHKTELVWERQRRLIATITQHPMSDHAISSCLPLATREGRRRPSRMVNININSRWPAVTRQMDPNERVQSHQPQQWVRSGKMGTERLPAWKRSLLCRWRRPGEAIPGKGCGFCWANLACVHRHTSRLHRILPKISSKFFLQISLSFKIFYLKISQIIFYWIFHANFSKISVILSNFSQNFSRVSSILNESSGFLGQFDMFTSNYPYSLIRSTFHR